MLNEYIEQDILEDSANKILFKECWIRIHWLRKKAMTEDKQQLGGNEVDYFFKVQFEG